MTEHLPECVTWSLAERYPGERPQDVSPYAWSQIQFMKCAPGCPIMDRAIERGRELAARYGW